MPSKDRGGSRDRYRKSPGSDKGRRRDRDKKKSSDKKRSREKREARSPARSPASKPLNKRTPSRSPSVEQHPKPPTKSPSQTSARKMEPTREGSGRKDLAPPSPGSRMKKNSPVSKAKEMMERRLSVTNSGNSPVSNTTTAESGTHTHGSHQTDSHDDNPTVKPAVRRSDYVASRMRNAEKATKKGVDTSEFVYKKPEPGEKKESTHYPMRTARSEPELNANNVPEVAKTATPVAEPPKKMLKSPDKKQEEEKQKKTVQIAKAKSDDKKTAASPVKVPLNKRRSSLQQPRRTVSNRELKGKKHVVFRPYDKMSGNLAAATQAEPETNIYSIIERKINPNASQAKRPPTPDTPAPLAGQAVSIAPGTVVPNGRKEAYKIVKVLGGGISSTVVLVSMSESTERAEIGKLWAMKITHDDPQFAALIEKEIQILVRLKYQDPDQINIVFMREYFTWNNHRCIVFENLYADLHRVNKCNDCRGFAEITARKFTRRMLVALHTLQCNELIHGDLKPENVLLKARNRTSIKLIDFGASSFLYEKRPPFEYVQSRWYRAPEVILGGPYTCAVDMWSLGCMVAEMLTGKPLLPGDSNADQLSCIIEMFGMPPSEVLKGCTKTNQFFRKANGWPFYCDVVPITQKGGFIVLGRENKNKQFRGPPGSKPIMDELKTRCNSLCLDFIERCLTWDPAERMRPGEGLMHKWIGRLSFY